jgi:Ca2+-binding RTX toxin-like protein
LLAVATGSVALLGGAADAAACTYDPATRVVTASMDNELESRIVRSGKAIVFVTTSSATPLSCGDATVANTKRIDVTGTGETSDVVNATPVTIDESLGRLAPGVGIERTTVREIEIRISVIPGDNLIHPVTKVPLLLVYVGTPWADRGTAGAYGLDVNGDGDVDVRTTAYPFGEYIFAGLGGNDRLSGGGSAATGGVVQAPMRLLGGPGDDRLRGGVMNDTLDESAGSGGDGYDLLIGAAGDDVLHGGARNDRLRGNSGEDELYGNAGHDLLYAKDGWADTVGGGSGIDDASVDDVIDAVSDVENIF